MKYIISENNLNKLVKIFEENSREVTFMEFKNELNDFLNSLLRDPSKVILNDFWKIRGFSLKKLLAILSLKEIIEKEEELGENGQMIIKFSVPKDNFDRKCKKLFIILFEKNLPKSVSETTTTGSAGISGDATLAVPFMVDEK